MNKPFYVKKRVLYNHGGNDGGGIALRAFHVVPDEFIAFFYSGLGCALFLAGVVFVVSFIRYKV